MADGMGKEKSLLNNVVLFLSFIIDYKMDLHNKINY